VRDLPRGSRWSTGYQIPCCAFAFSILTWTQSGSPEDCASTCNPIRMGYSNSEAGNAPPRLGPHGGHMVGQADFATRLISTMHVVSFPALLAVMMLFISLCYKVSQWRKFVAAIDQK
jgi:hypothetical protein